MVCLAIFYYQGPDTHLSISTTISTHGFILPASETNCDIMQFYPKGLAMAFVFRRTVDAFLAIWPDSPGSFILASVFVFGGLVACNRKSEKTWFAERSLSI